MITIHAVQAHEGDCLLLEHKYRNKKRFVLVDGGPNHTYDPHLEKTLKSKVARNSSRLDLVVLSHVDGDHVTGLLDLFVELRSAKEEGEEPLVKIAELWHNTFGLLDTRGDIGRRFRSIMAVAQVLMSASSGPTTTRQRANMALANMALATIKQGERLGREAKLLKVPTNKRFGGKPIVATTNTGTDSKTVSGLKVRVVGPTKKNLEALRKDWRKWLKKQEDRLRRGRFNLAAMADDSVPNLSSLQLLVEKNGKTALLTGDGRGDHLIEALKKANLCKSNGMDVDLLKVPHHGSDRNVTKVFFETIRAKTYLISANGKNGNPDFATLKWIVDTAKERNQRVTLAITNETTSVKKLRRVRSQHIYKYKLNLRPSTKDWLSINV